MNSDYILDQTYRFFAEGGMGGCQAGRRFLVVRPDGLINACSMFPDLQYAIAQRGGRGLQGHAGELRPVLSSPSGRAPSGRWGD